tara:strand:- start:631 stop:1575 length:945 start_codon:yes stop_codon:yes gene_type:complete
MTEADQVKKYTEYRNKKFLDSFFGIISVIFSIAFLTLPYDISDLLGIQSRFLIILGVLLFIIGLWFLFKVFLKSRPFRYYRSYNKYEEVDLNGFLNNHLKKNFMDKYDPDDDSEDKTDKPLFENELDSFKEKYIYQSLHDLEYAHLFEELNKLESKLKTQIERLISNSNLNLLIGIATSLIAIIILGSSIFKDNNFKDSSEFITFFIPRVSTVIFVEIFSFFFLRLYKSNLNEIKYFQNEITNLNFKITAIKTAIKIDDKPTLSQIILTFSNTERNFILKKGETTENIESMKMENSQVSTYSKSLSEILNLLKK